MNRQRRNFYIKFYAQYHRNFATTYCLNYMITLLLMETEQQMQFPPFVYTMTVTQYFSELQDGANKILRSRGNFGNPSIMHPEFIYNMYSVGFLVRCLTNRSLEWYRAT